MPTTSSEREQRELAKIKALQLDLRDRLGGVRARLDEIERHRGPGHPLLAFAHIPKTAGGTAINMMTRAFSRPAMQNCGSYLGGGERAIAKLRKPEAWERFTRRGGRALVGHVPYGVYLGYLPPDTRYMTILREPVDRVLSHYYRHIDMAAVQRVRPAGAPVKSPRAESLEAALVERRLPEVNDLATRFLCGHPEPLGELPESAVEDAKANLRKFAFVGLQERFEESMVLLQRLLGLGAVPYLNRHVSADRPAAEDISERDRELIIRCNTRDIELYEFARGLFDEAVAAADAGFAADVQNLTALSAEANEAAIEAAREWLDRELPPQTARPHDALLEGSTAAGVEVAGLRHVLTRTAQKSRTAEGVKIWTRLEAGRGSDAPQARSATASAAE